MREDNYSELFSILSAAIASCNEALSNAWDRSDDGFEAMRDDLEKALELINKS